MPTRDEVAARNRTLMPTFGQIVTEWRESWADLTVLHCREGELAIGSVPVYSGTWVNGRDMASLDLQRKDDNVCN